MTRPDDTWRPAPELLSAYFDGELTGRPDLDAVRARIQDWLRGHPEARAELADYRQLDRLWHETAPLDPVAATWQQREAQLQRAARALPMRPRRPAIGSWVAALLATAAAVALFTWMGLSLRPVPPPKQPVIVKADDVEVFPVATADEIAILHVAGADSHTVIVGELPVFGPLELAGPGEVALTSVQPDVRDNMMPHVRMGAHRPMIWARVAEEGP
jgi:anti-sigma factor RsiW